MEQNVDHNHEEDTTLARFQIYNALKREANVALCERPTKIIRRDGMSDVTDDMNRFWRNLSAAKLRTFLKLPINVLELYECVRTYSLKNGFWREFRFS